MTPDFKPEDQERFFSSLPGKRDYHIWGVSIVGDGPIGAAGIKNIVGRVGEYWGYVGAKQFWGQRLGAHMLSAVERKAVDLGLSELYLKVSVLNERAIRLYAKFGYRAVDRINDVDVMEKKL